MKRFLLLLLTISLGISQMWADVIPYAERTENGTTDGHTLYKLTFRVGECTPDNSTTFAIPESNFPEWRIKSKGDSDKPGEDTRYGYVNEVVFEESFASARPKTCYEWFDGQEYLNTITGIQYLNTSEVTNMTDMFDGCKRLTSIDLSHFDTSNVTQMQSMFCDCAGLTVLDLSSFDVSNVKYTNFMFSNCTNLKTIYVNTSWDLNLDSQYAYTGLFSGCTSLKGGSGTGYNSANIKYDYARIDNLSAGKPGYFTAKIELTANAGGDDYWTTYYNSSLTLKAPSNTTVYTGSLNADNSNILLTEVAGKIIPKRNAVILKSSSEAIALEQTTTDVTSLENNNLQGVDAETAKPAICYTLSRGNTGTGTLGFYLYSGTNVAANKAYLVIPSASRGFIGLGGDNGTTSIDDSLVESEEDTTGDKWYAIDGRQLSGKPTKRGIYVNSGHKYIVK